jgi:hypothetical protein
VGLGGPRFHDLRHYAITELAESKDVSEETIMAIAGHASPRMLRHYSHVARDAMREALDTLRRKPTGSDFSRQDEGGTLESTSQNASAQKPQPRNFKKIMVDMDGIEPATPCLQRFILRRINNLLGQVREYENMGQVTCLQGVSCGRQITAH